MKQSEKKFQYKRIVIKIGSSLFYREKKLDFVILREITRQMCRLVKGGSEIAVVSSGAIALGMHILGLQQRPDELCYLQAAAAIGQNELMNLYRKFLGKDLYGAQILLTWEDFDDRRRYLNAKSTIEALLDKRKYGMRHIIPVINENDSISTEEIRFGDNDQLSARVSALIGADLLIMLSDVDGLLNKNKEVVPVVDDIADIKNLAFRTQRSTSIGGMITKIEAAKIAADSGISCVIANGHKKGIILSLIREPQKQGTWFLPKKGNLKARKRWIAFGTKPKGSIIVDDGAKRALLNKKSLLSVGVASIAGGFLGGDIVSVKDAKGCEFARGRVGLSADELEKVKGARHTKEVIHCDNIAIL